MSRLHALTYRLVVVAGLISTSAMAGAVAGPAAHAATMNRFVATTGTDSDNDCTNALKPCATITQGVIQADDGDTVVIAAGSYGESLDIRKSLTLLGAGASGTHRTTVDGDGGSGPSVLVDGADTQTRPMVSIRNVSVSGNSSTVGVDVEEAAATIRDSVVSANAGIGLIVDNMSSATVSHTSITGNGGGGVVIEGSTTSIDHSVVSGNGDGGVDVEDSVNGPAASPDVEESATIDTTTLDANVGAGVVVDSVNATVLVTGSTVSGTVPFENQAEDFGAGVLVFGGGARIDNSTIARNTGQGVLSESGSVAISRSTITGTRSPATPPTQSDPPVGSIVVATAAAPNAVTGAVTDAVTDAASTTPGTAVSATITADNQVPNCAGSVVDVTYNLSDDKTCRFSQTGSRNNRPAHLRPLHSNGGPTKTQVPAPPSYALDAIPRGKAFCVAHATDQRGVSRPQGKRCDIGAVEKAQKRLVIRPKNLPRGSKAKHYKVKLRATGGLGAPYTWSLASGKLPHGVHLRRHGTLVGTPRKSGRFHVVVSVDHSARHRYTLTITPKHPRDH